MLGRHVYRVSPLQTGGWSVQKDGEATARGTRATRDDATHYAWELAAADEPSKVIVEDQGGAIADERLFGVDTALEMERAVEAQHAPPPKGEPPGRG
jgi:hypothetical protein